MCPLSVKPPTGSPKATSSGWFSELLRGAPLFCHSSKSVVDALCCLPPARHRRRGLEIQPELHSFPCRFHSLAYSMAYSIVPYHTFLWYIAEVLHHPCTIQQVANLPYHNFLSYIAGMLYHTCVLQQVVISHLFVVHSRDAKSRMCYIADCHITPFLWYVPHDKTIHSTSYFFDIACYIALLGCYIAKV